MEGKAFKLVFGIKKHEDRTRHSFFAFCQTARGVDITQLSEEFNKHGAKIDVTKISTEFNKHRAQITQKTPESQHFGTSICL